jgi:hypothetical protein
MVKFGRKLEALRADLRPCEACSRGPLTVILRGLPLKPGGEKGASGATVREATEDDTGRCPACGRKVPHIRLRGLSEKSKGGA